MGFYKFRNDAWRISTSEDIADLNAALLLHCSSEQSEIPISEFLARFFPNKPFISRAVRFSLSSGHYAALRGHPVTIEFDACRENPEAAAGESHLAGATAGALPSDIASDVTATASTPSSSDSEVTRSPIALSVTLTATPSAPESPIRVAATAAAAPVAVSPTPAAMRLPPSDPPVHHTTSNDDGGVIGGVGPFNVTFEFSAGLCVVRPRATAADEWEVLVIRRLGDPFYEIPKGHLERGETLQQAAEREVREETGLLNDMVVHKPLLSELYTVKTAEQSRVEKTVHYFAAELRFCPQDRLAEACNTECNSSPWTTDEDWAAATPQHPVAWFGSKETETREVCWVSAEEAKNLCWKSNTVSYVVGASLRHNGGT